MFFPVLLTGPLAGTLTKQDVTDVFVGTGKEVQTGDLVKVHVNVQTVDGKNIADTSKRGMAMTFELVEPKESSWKSMVQGMKIGGTRKLTLSSLDEWGSEGNPPIVSPGSVLIVTVKLLQAKPGEVTRTHAK